MCSNQKRDSKEKITQNLQDLLLSPGLNHLAATLIGSGGKPFIVGGSVRDALLGIRPKDIDIEVFGLAAEELKKILLHLGRVDEVGAHFGIFKFSYTFNDVLYHFDISLPRTERKNGAGHKAFAVSTDTELSFKEAALRRDFTVNALGYELGSHILHDPYNGQNDLQTQVLRHVSHAFAEDPLRVLRAAQFCSRFSFSLAPETIIECQKIAPEIAQLPAERIAAEIEKMLLAPKPSLGLAVLRSTAALQHFPELQALIDCPQDPKWHPEGDVWTHTLMVTDEGALIAQEQKLSKSEHFLIVLACLCHDLGKPVTTIFEDGRFRSKNHDVAGEKPTLSLLKRFGFPLKLSNEIVPLVREHLRPMQLYREKDSVSHAAIRRLSARVSIERLCMVSRADFLGRTTPEALSRQDPSSTWLLSLAEQLNVASAAPEALLSGRHLLEYGVAAPGPQMGRILKKAYQEQLEGTFDDLAGALEWIHKNYKKLP